MKLKRLFSIVVILLLALFAASALDGSVTWYWYENDSNVEYYRYQVDGEDEDGWTILPWYESSVTIDLDVSVVHTLYLQQSYDGIVWSPSSCTDSDIVEEQDEYYEDDYWDFEDDYYEEEEFEDSFEVIGTTEVDMAQMQIYEAPELGVYKAQRYLDLGFGYLNGLPNTSRAKQIGLSSSYSRTFLSSGIGDAGLKSNIGLYTSKSFGLDMYFSIMGLYTFKVGNCDLYGAMGPEISMTITPVFKLGFGLCLEAGVRYNLGDNFSLGLALSDHQILLRRVNRANYMDIRVFYSKQFK